MSDDPLEGILNRLKEATDLSLGPADPVVPTKRQLEEAEKNAQIILLAQNGLTYIDIARELDMPVGMVIRRVVGMMKGVPLYTQEHMAAYLAHQLELLQVGIESAVRDVQDWRDGDLATEKLAGENRHSGRMGLAKLLVHQAAILGLMRQQIDITRREQVEITVIRGEDYDAL